jgi:uncharacterized protein (TIGR02453 family)
MLQDTILFLQNLSQNNTKAYFDQHKDEYKTLQTEFNGFVEQLLHEIYLFDNQIQMLTAKDCTYRINRDIRFSNNKTPYKTWMGAYISPNGRATSKPAYFFRITAEGKLRVGVGHWIHDTKDLFRVRTNVLEHAQELTTILSSKEIQKHFDGLYDWQTTRAPRGFDKTDPSIHLALYKSYACIKEIDISNSDYTKLKKTLLTIFKSSKPFIDYLRKMDELQIG